MIEQEHIHKQEFEFTGKHMATLMILFFGVIISVNVTMAFLAKGTWTGLVVKNSYVASQKFNSELEAARLQKASGIHSDLDYASGSIRIVLKDKDGITSKVSELQIEVGRPAYEQADMIFEPVMQSFGAYTHAVNLAEGLWAVQINAMVDGNPYRRDARIFIGRDGTARVQ